MMITAHMALYGPIRSELHRQRGRYCDQDVRSLHETILAAGSGMRLG